jgi:hypothetical protein
MDKSGVWWFSQRHTCQTTPDWKRMVFRIMGDGHLSRSGGVMRAVPAGSMFPFCLNRMLRGKP